MVYSYDPSYYNIYRAGLYETFCHINARRVNPGPYGIMFNNDGKWMDLIMENL